MSERYISPKARGIQEGVNPSAKERSTEKPNQHRVGEQIPYPLPTEAEIATSLRRLEQIAQGDEKRGGAKEAREQKLSPMERIRNLSSMLAGNIKGLRILGPTGRKIGKGLLLASAFGLAAETGAVWQAKNMYKDDIMRRLGQEEVAADIESGKKTRVEVIDLIVEKSRVNLEVKREMASSGLTQFTERATAELGRVGALWAGHELKGDKVASEDEQQYVREFYEGFTRVIDEFHTARGE